MRSTISLTKKISVTSEMINDSTFQILEYDDLKGFNDKNTIKNQIYIKRLGLKLNQIRILLDDSAVKLQINTLSFMKGNIKIKENIYERPKIGKGLFKLEYIDQSMIKPILGGVGEIFLEPSYDYFSLLELEDEEVIISDSVFYACEDSIEVSVISEEEYEEVKLKLVGSGIIALRLPVSEEEILRCKIFKNKIYVNEENCILRTKNISVVSENTKNTMVGNSVDNENKINVYHGTGEIWILPTKNIYESLSDINYNMLNTENEIGEEVDGDGDGDEE